MSPLLVLLPSPLLGPATWEPVADVLARLGVRTTTPALGPGLHTPADVLDRLLEALPAGEDLALVPHSGAGAYIPALTAARRVSAAIFVDAVLPPPSGRVPMAPSALLDQLRATAGPDGLLPVWTSWWDEADVAPLFPDAASRAAVQAEQQQLPLDYFTGSLPVPAGWEARPAGYLAFGETYGPERSDATARGWPVHTLDGEHLHQLVAPEAVATAILDLLHDSCDGNLASWAQ